MLSAGFGARAEQSLSLRVRFPETERGINRMDKDRIKGSADQAKGAAKDAAGKILGDQKLQAEGKMDKLKGKTESAVGGAKDALRDMDRKNQEEKKH
jgi:uncharacterized protein YjbJ (UPF0337 family)